MLYNVFIFRNINREKVTVTNVPAFKYFKLGPRHTMPEEKFENAALFLRLGLPSTLTRHENGAFLKRSSNRRNLKTPALRFRVVSSAAVLRVVTQRFSPLITAAEETSFSLDEKYFENDAFRLNDNVTIIM